jgi:alkylresorcinol/alkylpyrone synthase
MSAGGPGARLLSLATAAPPIVLTQAEAKDFARELFGRRARDFERLEPVFDNAGIETRRIVQPPQWYRGDHGWRSRTQVYLEAADALFVEAAERALAQAGLAAREVDAVVTVSTTGIATPSIEARVAERIGFRDDIRRVPVFGLGCAGGVTGLATAARLAAAEPRSTVLFVTIEICSTAIRLDKLTKANIVATALFGDGAAAAVLRSGDAGGGIGAVEGAGEVLWPGTLGIMGWDVEDPGLGVIFDRAIPPFVGDNMAEGVERILRGIGLGRGDVGRFACHPGGAKVVAALEESLGLESGSLDLERDVLREYGNMSAPTVLFVLERLIARGLPERTMLLALGPGFTASGLSLVRA